MKFFIDLLYIGIGFIILEIYFVLILFWFIENCLFYNYLIIIVFNFDSKLKKFLIFNKFFWIRIVFFFKIIEVFCLMSKKLENKIIILINLIFLNIFFEC